MTATAAAASPAATFDRVIASGRPNRSSMRTRSLIARNPAWATGIPHTPMRSGEVVLSVMTTPVVPQYTSSLIRFGTVDLRGDLPGCLCPHESSLWLVPLVDAIHDRRLKSFLSRPTFTTDSLVRDLSEEPL